MPTPAGEQLLSTLRPALGEIEAQLDALSELRELPSGSLRLTAGPHAVRTVLWPVLLRLNTRYPDIKIEVSIDATLTDIVTEGYERRRPLGGTIARDMIAQRMAPIYGGWSSDARPISLTTASRGKPQDLTHHRLLQHPPSDFKWPLCLGSSSATDIGSTST